MNLPAIHPTATLTAEGLQLRCPRSGLSDDRPLTAADTAKLRAWADRHQAAARREQSSRDLLALGTELFDWLNGSTQFLRRLLETVQPPLLFEFAVARQEDSERARAFLDAPWELLASNGRHWALDGAIVFCPVRRIGQALAPPAPSPHRLSVLFMAASPRGAEGLNYEAEEATILAAAKNVALDLAVEESGTLERLAACVAREQPEVVHVSCHGILNPEPGLLLENEVGDLAFADTAALVSRLASAHPRLLFLSACETACADPVLDSLARSLIRSGAPAVVGWAAPVLELEATLFAAALYARLTAGESLAHALAYARLELARSNQLRAAPLGGPGSRHWHLARLYVNPFGGGPLATANGARRLVGHGQAIRTFLDSKKQQVPVAGESEFVGRRREIQKVLREFRAEGSERRAGVFVHGLGRQGKSSLAARVAHRLERTHDLVVVFGRYDAPAILAAFRDRLGSAEVAEIVNRHALNAAQDPASLSTALHELLTGPCQQQKSDDKGQVITRPVLLVIDDFERALEPNAALARHGVKPELVAAIRAVILAFKNTATQSRLLFTSRYQFSLMDGGRDLAEELVALPLPAMDPHESRKQAAARLRLASEDARSRTRNLGLPEARLDRVIAAAQGNAGLQNLLFLLGLENPEACDRCLAQMEEYRRTGALPAADQVREFLENLAVGALLGLLTPPERELLRASTLFEVPVPVAAMARLAEAVGPGSAAKPAGRGAGATSKPPRAHAHTWESGRARLIALGLWEVHEDMHDAHAQALAVNALVRPLAGGLDDAEQAALAGATSAVLFEQWGGVAGRKQRRYAADHELTRLGLLAKDPRVLGFTTANALRFLDRQFECRQAALWAREAVAILDAAGVAASIDLLRTAAERCQQVGGVAEANALRQRALATIQQAIRRGEAIDSEDHAATLLAHARGLVEQGQPDQALEFLEEAKALLPPGREQAIVLVEIARLRAAKGEVAAALELHQESLGIFDALGDQRSRAVALGEIANIYASKGQVDKALELHQEELRTYETIGDRHSKAVTLWEISQIEMQQRKWQTAHDHLSESYAILLELGRLDGICMVGMALGPLLCARGKGEDGLKMLIRSRDGFRRLGRATQAQQAQALVDGVSQLPSSTSESGLPS